MGSGAIPWGWVLVAALRTGQVQVEKAARWVDGGKEGLEHWGTRRRRNFCSLIPALSSSFPA